MATSGGVVLVTPTPAPVMSIPVDESATQIQVRWTAAQNETVNMTGSPNDGQRLVMVIANGPAPPRTITFGTGLVAGSNLVGTANKKAIIIFIADGGVYLELVRKTGL